MKRYLLPLAAIALLVSCTTEVLNQDSEIVSHVTITATDFEFDTDTRTNLDPSSGGLSFTWAESDVVGIFPNAGDQVKFPMTAGAGTKSANFDGGGWALRNNYSYAAYYPFSKANYDNSYTALPITYLGQSQSANNSTAGLGAYDYMVATASMPESGSVAFNFQHIGSVLYIQLTTPDAATFTKLTLSAEEAIFLTEATLNISDATLTPVTSKKYLTLDMENIDIEAGGTLYAWMLIAPVNASSMTLKAVVTASNNSTYSANIVGKTFETGKAYKLTGTLAKVGPYLDNLVLNGHDYVDLDLPSGTLWATMNVGATSPEKWGTHFAWGEITTKIEWSWGTYKYCDDSEGYSITKYNSEDNKTTLDLSDDAASTEWEGSWRMPTYDDWQELIVNCTWTWTTENGVNGQKVTSNSNGNYIFLPAASHRYEGGMDVNNYLHYENGSCCYGIMGFYWSSSFYDERHGWYTNISETGVYQTDGLRWTGHSLRPVCRP